MTLTEVVRGLRNGQSFKRKINETGGIEIVRPIYDGRSSFSHTVEGGGWGGYNEMPITTLWNGRWADSDWERI